MGISVKVSTKKVIAAMEQKVAANTKKIAEFEKEQKHREWVREKHKKYVQTNAARIAKAAGVTPEISVCDARSWGPNSGKIQVELTYYLSKEDAKELETPTFENERLGFTPENLRQENEELGNAIRLLNMTDEEYVNTNTYKHVAKYL
jgi:prenyltransferase beta subunit